MKCREVQWPRVAKGQWNLSLRAPEQLPGWHPWTFHLGLRLPFRVLRGRSVPHQKRSGLYDARQLVSRRWTGLYVTSVSCMTRMLLCQCAVLTRLKPVYNQYQQKTMHIHSVRDRYTHAKFTSSTSSTLWSNSFASHVHILPHKHNPQLLHLLYLLEVLTAHVLCLLPSLGKLRYGRDRLLYYYY